MRLPKDDTPVELNSEPKPLESKFKFLQLTHKLIMHANCW